jgi:endoglucanase
MKNRHSFKTILSTLFFFLFLTQNNAQTLSENIRLNQIGFYPNATKEAVLVGDKKVVFFVLTENKKDTVFRGKLSPQRINSISQKTSQIADFSTFKKEGKYVVFMPEVGYSYPFVIQKQVHRAAAIASLKGYYFQRMSTELLEKHAGIYKRPAGHPDDKVLIHASAATKERPENTVISAPKGWYDAGDYNKYIVNSGISTGTLFLLYENHPDYFKTFETNIPESGDAIPDLLDEALWNLRWMLAMQDPNDGGVYHKLTNPKFDGMDLMPHQATKERYVIQKTITATLDFAAVMAQASRIFKKFDKQMPKFADSCLVAAEKAWAWAEKNPDKLYDQNEMNKKYTPSVLTGAYDDKNASDEWAWAATELYITTKNDKYYTSERLYPTLSANLQTWREVHRMSYYALIQHQDNLTDLGKKDLPKLKKVVLDFADDLLMGVDKQAYNTVMGKSVNDFHWGSSGHAANQGIALLQAYKLTKNKKYLNGALSNLDYLFGKNAVGYSFLTGFGSKQVLHIHHRPSESDGIEKPVVGLLSGGANKGKQDKCEGYTTDIADECFLDVACSYSTNEICINWNAPMVYLAAAIEILQGDF